MYEHVNNDFWLSWINEIIENRKKNRMVGPNRMKSQNC